MHIHDLSPWQHDHAFDAGNPAGERGTRVLTWLTALMMMVEVSAGWAFNSMALLADGFHMSSHAVAIGLSAYAYAAARRNAADRRYAFGTWKIEVLGGFASAVFLLFIAALMIYGSVDRLILPRPIGYEEAILVAVVGLAVNLVSARILGAAHDHRHGHHHHDGEGNAGHPRDHRHRDLNLRSAYVHVIADAATSVMAVVALLGGWMFGWSWIDPVMGIVGAAVVAVWARNLILDTSKVLLDREMDDPMVEEIREAVENGGRDIEAKVADLHVWRVGKGAYACALTVVSHDDALTPNRVRQWISRHEEVVHPTIEVHVCPSR